MRIIVRWLSLFQRCDDLLVLARLLNVPCSGLRVSGFLRDLPCETGLLRRRAKFS
jgi:hypothetical protein